MVAWHGGHPCWQNRRDMTRRTPVTKRTSNSYVDAAWALLITTDRHPCLLRDSNRHSQQVSGSRPSHQDCSAYGTITVQNTTHIQ